MRRFLARPLGVVTLCALMLCGLAGGARAALQETPYFANEVASGKLPRSIDKLADDPEMWVTR